MFRDRSDAGRHLAGLLQHLKSRRPAVLALPRGGVPVGFEVAAALGTPLDVLLVRKIGAPHQPELALGAVAEGTPPDVYVDSRLVDMLGVPEDYIEAETARQVAELERRREAYCSGRARVPIEGTAVIIVDDGIATGATMHVALRAARARNPERLILAVPVAAAKVLDRLRPLADEVICVETPPTLDAVGAYYMDFH
ncbi:MAG: phosphoribosyltransferase family protein, partial [Gammaproteobacteria bacterium]